MNERSNTKLKTLYLWKILREKTDEEHPLNAHELVEELKGYGIKAERKSIYDSLQALKDYGLQIEQAHPAYHGWYLMDRMFEEPELLLLIDAIESANIINWEKSNELVDILLNSSLSKNEKKSFQERYSYSPNPNKPETNKALYQIETISQAIEEKKKLEIKYTRQTVDGSSSRIHVVSPYALIWSDDAYYLVCNTSRHDNFMHLRLDRMDTVNKSSEDARDCREFTDKYPGGFNAEVYRREMFNGFSGEEETVTLQCDNSLYQLMRERFGKETEMEREDGAETFTFQAAVMAGEGFVRWVAQFGDKVTVLSPDHLRNELRHQAEKTLNLYKEGTKDETDTED